MRSGRLLLFGLFWLGAACGRESRPPDLLIITLDAVRADVTPGFGGDVAVAPNLGRWLEKGTRFTRAYTVAPLTIPAHSSLLTGLYPAHHGARRHGPGAHAAQPLGLVVAARAAGFATGAFVSSKVLIPGQAPLADFDFVDKHWTGIERPAAATAANAVRWLRHQPPSTPVFLWVHLFDAHAPYAPSHPLWRHCPPENRDQAFDWAQRSHPACSDPDRPVALPSTFTGCVRDLYDSQLKDLDGAVAEVVKGMASRGRFVWAIAADHGECLGEEGYVAQHGGVLLECAVQIPLALGGTPAFPASAVRTDLVSLVDVAPTLAQLYGWSLPGVDGIDLTHRERASKDGIALEAAGVNVEGCTAPSLGAWRGDEKVLFAPLTARTRAWRRHGAGAVEIEPAELSQAGQELARELSLEPPSAPPAGRHDETSADDSVMQVLKALGYVE